LFIISSYSRVRQDSIGEGGPPGPFLATLLVFYVTNYLSKTGNIPTEYKANMFIF